MLELPRHLNISLKGNSDIGVVYIESYMVTSYSYAKLKKEDWLKKEMRK